ncbi:MAG: hypothetical protein FD146_1245 [Anaerolineaceae bacterium]|nr:MAG: hypothetical protein FD146_1245 [Anaerolineaceae bacterium]
MPASTIGGINLLPEPEKREIYARLIPRELTERLRIPPSFVDEAGRPLLDLRAVSGKTDVELRLYHRAGFADPVLYGHMTDTLSGQIHILLYIVNDPDSPRFDVDIMPDGSPTKFGMAQRNLSAEQAALEAGLAPGQTRRGLRILPPAIIAFEQFVASLGNDVYFVEPLYYHVAAIFEKYGFAYQVGKKLMERIQAGFSQGGDLRARLDGATPFRRAEAAQTIRLRSWAIHDGLLGEPFTNVTMYKRVGKLAGVSTCQGCPW